MNIGVSLPSDLKIQIKIDARTFEVSERTDKEKYNSNLVPIQEDTEYDIREINSTITLLGIIRIIV